MSNIHKVIPKTWATFMTCRGGYPLHCWPLNNALLIMPVASIYRSTHLEMQLLSPPLRLELGFVIHLSKHFPLTVCKINSNCNVSAIYKFAESKTHQIYLVFNPMTLLRTYPQYHMKDLTINILYPLTKMLHFLIIKKNLKFQVDETNF